MKNKECTCVVCEQSKQLVKEGKKKRKINWFNDHEVLYIEPSKQRTVLLNPGIEKEYFRKVYPVKGELVLKRKEYISDIPQQVVGKIIAVTAVSKYSGAIPGMKGKKFEDIRDRMSQQEMSEKGLLKPKPIGTFFELFEGNGTRIWVNPKEYRNTNTRRNRKRRKNEKAAG